MRILYWNCTYGVSERVLAKAKAALIRDVLQLNAPDIVCLDEVSKTVGDAAAAQELADDMSGTVVYEHQKNGLITNPGAHLNSVVLAKKTTSKKRKAGELTKCECSVGIGESGWAELMKRDLVRVKYWSQDASGNRNVWFLHANASASGGRNAVDVIVPFVEDTTDVEHVFVGDFNFGLNKNAARVRKLGEVVRKPMALSSGGVRYTQWRKQSGREPGWIPIPDSSSLHYRPNDVLDFAIAPTSVSVTREDPFTLLTPQQKRDLLLVADHCPVLYTIDDTTG